MPQLVSKPVSWFRPDPNQPRKTFPEAELRLLGESLKVRQNDPLQAFVDGLLIDGERRLRAAKLVGLEKLDVIITETMLTPAQINVVRLTSFFHKADLSAFEKWLACSDLMAANPVWQIKNLADALKLDASSVTRYLSPSKCIPEWQDALKAGKVGISDCYQASLMQASEQKSLLEFKLSGNNGKKVSRNKLADAARQLRSADATPEVRLSRIRCPLSSGVTVTVSGPDMTLQDLIMALSETLEKAKSAKKDSLNVRTAERVWKDRAKAASQDKPQSGNGANYPQEK
jgi:ParB/RepB/Spo0J family partition protein